MSRRKLDRDGARLVGPRRRDQHLDAGGVADQVPVELLVVERRAGLHQVVHRPLGREPEGEADVAELEVEVDEDDVRVALGERDGEVRRDERLPGAALRPEDRDERRRRLAGDGEALAARDHLLRA